MSSSYRRSGVAAYGRSGVAAYRRSVTALLFLLTAYRSPLTGQEARIDSLFAGWSRTDGPGCIAGVKQSDTSSTSRRSARPTWSTAFRSPPNRCPNRAPSPSSSPRRRSSCWRGKASSRSMTTSGSTSRKYRTSAARSRSGTCSPTPAASATSGRCSASRAGRRARRCTRSRSILDLVSRQRMLNFEPGSLYLYSNTGYALAAAIVPAGRGQVARRVEPGQPVPAARHEEHGVARRLSPRGEGPRDRLQPGPERRVGAGHAVHDGVRQRRPAHDGARPAALERCALRGHGAAHRAKWSASSRLPGVLNDGSTHHLRTRPHRGRLSWREGGVPRRRHGRLPDVPRPLAGEEAFGGDPLQRGERERRSNTRTPSRGSCWAFRPRRRRPRRPWRRARRRWPRWPACGATRPTTGCSRSGPRGRRSARRREGQRSSSRRLARCGTGTR